MAAIRCSSWGATPQDVEKEILLEHERFLRTVPNLDRMVSTVETGRATIRLEFPFGVDVTGALIRVNNALSQVPAYPENVDELRLSTNSFSENAFMYDRLAARDGNPLGIDLNLMQDFDEDHVRPLMERVAGVSRVDVSGGAARPVRIEVDAARLAERGLWLVDLRDAVRLHHAELRALSVAGGQRTLNLSVLREPGSNVIAITRAMTDVVDEKRCRRCWRPR
jgi:multidrug efflux pump subunit AcrB